MMSRPHFIVLETPQVPRTATPHRQASIPTVSVIDSVEGGDPSVQDSGSGSADRSGKQKQMTEGNERVRGRCSRITSSK